jgi:alpha-glucosidase
VADPRDVDPTFGTLRDFDGLVTDAHEHGLRVIIDVVPNHTSIAHPWFQAALAAPPGSAERSRYIFRDGRGPDGAQPPNNWQAVFGGSAWTRVDKQWYLHLFTPEQPDLDWHNPEVGADYEKTLRFWLDRGVDGFRIDVAHGLFKDPSLPDTSGGSPLDLLAEKLAPTPMWNQPGVHDVYRRWRAICAGYAHEPVLVGEVWIGDPAVVAEYVRPDELHLAFNFRLLFSRWGGPAYRHAIEQSTQRLHAVGAPPTWVLGNHDVDRQVTRYGGGERGLRRARAALLVLLALPGPAFLYQGEELGLPEVVLPDEALQDPIWVRSGHTIRGRDGCRVPLPWDGAEPPYGFSPAGTATWLPMPADWAGLAVTRQWADPSSTLALYAEALRCRRAEPALGDGDVVWQDGTSNVGDDVRDDVVDFARPHDAGSVRCVANLGTEPVQLPAGEVLISSVPISSGALPSDAAAWIRMQR